MFDYSFSRKLHQPLNPKVSSIFEKSIYLINMFFLLVLFWFGKGSFAEFGRNYGSDFLDYFIFAQIVPSLLLMYAVAWGSMVFLPKEKQGISKVLIRLGMVFLIIMALNNILY